MWEAESRLVHVTFAPFLIRTVGVLKAKFCMETVAFFGAATGVIAGVVAGLMVVGVVVFTGVIVLVVVFCTVVFCVSVCGSCSSLGVVTSLDMATGAMDGVVGCTTATFFEAQAFKTKSDTTNSIARGIFFIQ